MDINSLLKTVTKYRGLRFRRIQRNVKCRHLLDKSGKWPSIYSGKQHAGHNHLSTQLYQELSNNFY